MTESENGRMARGFLTFADQAMSSATNFALSFAALRMLPLEGFGSVAIVVLAFGLSLRVSRSLASVPMLIRYKDSDDGGHPAVLRRSTGSSLLIGVVLGLVVLVVAELVGGETATVMRVLACFLPLLLVQDGYRHGWFAIGRPIGALWLDTIWFALTLLALGILAAEYRLTSVTIVTAWASAGALVAVVGAFASRTPPAPTQAARWMANQKDLGIPLLIEQVLAAGSRQIVLYFVAILAGLETLGAVHGARTLFGPLNVLYLGSTPFVVPEVVRLRKSRPHRVYGFVGGVGSLLVLCAVGLAIVLLVVPDSWMVRVIGPSWLEVQPYVIPTAIAAGAMGIVQTIRAGFRGMELPIASLTSTSFLAGLRVALGVGATSAIGVLAGVYGLAVANSVGAAHFAWSFSRRVAQREES